MKTKTINYRYLFYGALVVFLLFNLATASFYGMTWDEAAQHHIGQVALGYLGGQTDKLEFLRDDLVYYGPFFEIINQYFGQSLLEAFDISYVVAFHILIIITAGIGLLFLFKLVQKLFNQKVAFWSAIFLMLLPRFVAHSQYNSKDIPLLALFVIVFYFLYTAFFENKIWSFVWAGIFFGLALATRVDALLILPIFFLALLVKKRLQLFKLETMFKTSIFLVVSVVTLYIVWPSLWRDPVLFFSSVKYFLSHGWQGSVLYLGQIYTAAQLPWHYAPFYFLLAVPVLLLIFAGFGFFKIFKELKNKKNIFAHFFVLSWLFIRILIAVLPGAVRYDGIRHFLPILPALMIVSALGFVFVLKKLNGKKILKNGLMAVAVLWLLVEFFVIFPFGGSYFNEITRVIYPQNIEDKMEIEYWGATYKQGIDWLNKNAVANSSFCAPLAEHLLQFYPVRRDLSFNCSQKTDYLMFFTRWSYLPEDLNEIFDYQQKKPIFSIVRYNSALLKIFDLTK